MNKNVNFEEKTKNHEQRNDIDTLDKEDFKRS